ncbi:MAG TPA: polyprenol phosphomannose-dependent alpha 1,6 mannosyltransferase MptB [Micromonosporaceae bacterium]|nr:polyprenol phosphomannose-dependent alpha 1,6 mannosyltransferase MptB [Micromonosporaceae bacterium]
MPAGQGPGPAAPRGWARRGWWFLAAAGLGLLAAAAFAAGALPGTDPAVAVRQTGLPGAPARYLAGLGAWLAGCGLLVAAWWRLADPARRGARAAGLLAVPAALAALLLVLAPPLGSRDIYAYACHGALVVDGHDPYTVGAAAGCPWAGAVPQLWRDTPAPYGPVAIAASAGAAALARTLPAGPDAQLLAAVGLLRAVALAGVAMMAWYGARLATRVGGDPAVAVWLGAVTPLVVVHAVSGAHNDALVAGLVLAAFSAAAGTGPAVSARAAGTAGALLGLAVAVKVTALVAVPFAVLLIAGAGRHPGRAAGAGGRLARAGALVLGSGALAFAAVSTAVAALPGVGTGLGWVAALGRTGSLVQWTSLPTGLGMAAGYGLRVLGWPQAYEEAVAVARALGLAALAAVLVLLWWRAWRRAAAPRGVVAAAGAALAATAVLGPVFYPWYALAPLAVLATCATSDRARRWLAGVTTALTLLVLPFGLGLAVLTKLPGALLDVAAVIAAALWWRRRRGGPTTPTARA